jgi:AAHS family 4-hydroxybenzoate transporter-like MFS transporter
LQDAPKINVSELIDNSRIGSFQIVIYILCGFSLMLDGFDVQAIGYVAKSLFSEWHIPNSAGRVVSSTLIGVLFGSILLSMLADKIGRRPVLIVATIYFSILTILTTQVTTLNALLWIRFFAGIGLGGIMPNAVALVGEYSPKRSRVTIMLIVANGFTAGAAIGGIVASWLVPAYGWKSVFYVGGTLPLVIGVAMILLLPESIQFLVQLANPARARERIVRWLKQVAPSSRIDAKSEFFVSDKRRKGVPFVRLFHDGRTGGTLLIWVINFLNLLNLYFLAAWLPTVAQEAGYNASTSILVGSTLQIGGTIGALSLGWFIHRMGFIPVLASCFTLACINIALIGQPGLSLMLLITVVFVAGIGIVGGQAGVNALSATFYPTDLRSTGIGAGLGVGRIGSIIGPTLGEYMRREWPVHQLFYAAAVPALVAALVLFFFRNALKSGLR